MPRSLFTVTLLVTLISGCKLAIIAPAEGDISSASGTSDCSAGNVCSISINSATYSDAFTAVPGPGYEFVQWQSGDDFVCGGSTAPTCTVSLTGDALSQAIVSSDQTYYALPLFNNVAPGTLGFSDFVASAKDDAEEDSLSGGVDRYSNDLDFRGGGYNSSASHWIGLRFSGTEIPVGATITKAHITFVADGAGNGDELELEIRVEARDSGTFGSGDFDISNRQLAPQREYWDFTANLTEGQALTTPDIRELLQAVVDDVDWAAPNEEDDITFILQPVPFSEGLGHQEVYSWDGALSVESRPRLYVEYVMPGAP